VTDEEHLPGLEHQPLETQVAVLANEVRNQWGALRRMSAEFASVKRALWGFALTIAASASLFALTIFFR